MTRRHASTARSESAELNELEAAEFGRRVYLMRVSRRLSRAELAKKVQTSEAFIKKIENGYSYPSWKMAHRIADALGVAISYFFDLGRSPRVITVYPTLEESMFVALQVMRNRKQVLSIPLDLLRCLADRNVQRRVRDFLGLSADSPKYVQTQLDSVGLRRVSGAAIQRFPSVAKPKISRRIRDQ